MGWNIRNSSRFCCIDALLCRICFNERSQSNLVCGCIFVIIIIEFRRHHVDILLHYSPCVQDILDKFEYLPIKAKILRAKIHQMRFDQGADLAEQQLLFNNSKSQVQAGQHSDFKRAISSCVTAIRNTRILKT